MSNDAIMAGEAFFDEMLCCGDEICERVGLLFTLAVFVPRKTFVFAAANMRNGINEATINK